MASCPDMARCPDRPDTAESTGTADGAVAGAVAAAFRTEWARVVASVARFTGDLDLAEDCAQDAAAAALVSWRRDGVPDNPGAWLTTAARNRALDRIRRSALERARVRALATRVDQPGPPPGLGGAGGEELALLFTCCHPALAVQAQVALTLRACTGLTTAEIARAFLVPEATMAQRLVRAKRKIRHAPIPFRVPGADQIPARTAAVLAVVHLLFTEGHSATAGLDPIRTDLCDRALDLARRLYRLLPTDPEVAGLLVLLELTDARRAARLDDAGDLVPLSAQDRRRWDSDRISHAVAVLEDVLARRTPGPYQVQAAIAALHATAPTAADTDWRQIAALYTHLPPTPAVELNRAVALARAGEPDAALTLVADLTTTPLGTGHLLPATRADLLLRAGRTVAGGNGIPPRRRTGPDTGGAPVPCRQGRQLPVTTRPNRSTTGPDHCARRRGGDAEGRVRPVTHEAWLTGAAAVAGGQKTGHDA